MIDMIPGTWTEIITIGAVALGGIGIGIRKLHSMWASDGTHIQHSQSERDLFAMMSDSLTRVEAQNKELRIEVNGLEEENLKLKIENINRDRDIAILKHENESLKQMLLELREEVNRLKQR